MRSATHVAAAFFEPRISDAARAAAIAQEGRRCPRLWANASDREGGARGLAGETRNAAKVNDLLECSRRERIAGLDVWRPRQAGLGELVMMNGFSGRALLEDSFGPARQGCRLLCTPTRTECSLLLVKCGGGERLNGQPA